MIGAAALLVAAGAGFTVWRAGWLGVAPQDADVQAQLAKARAEADEAKQRAQAAAAAAAEAKRQLEAERASEAKARLEAEVRTKVEAEAKARAEAERKARAETEAKARADARTIKPAPAREAPVRAAEPPPVIARRDPEPQPAPAPSSGSSSFLPNVLWGSSSARTAQEKTPAPSAPTAYDGAWTATRTCEAYEELPSQVVTSAVNVKGGEFVVAVGTPGQPGYSQARGKPADDGLLTLRGEGVAISKRFLGMAHPVFFRGRGESDRIVLRGTLGDRNCTLVLARR